MESNTSQATAGTGFPIPFSSASPSPGPSEVPSAGDELAQSFVLDSAQANLKSAQLYLRAVGEVEGSMTLTIEGDSNSAPDGSPLMTSTLPALAVTSKTGEYYAFYAQSKFNLAAKTTYWLRLKGPSISNYSSYVVWGANSSNAVKDGKAIYETAVNGVWADPPAADWDLIFKLGCD